jgi:hypothetical protein
VLPKKLLEGKEDFMRKLTLLALSLSAAVVCTQAVSAKPPPDKTKKNVVASATGSGHVTQNAALRTFSFSARERADGTDRGQAQLRNRGAGNVPIHVRITCLNVVGDVAHMTGFVSRIRTETPPNFVKNSKVAFSVEDNGQTGDRISLMSFFGNVAELNCVTPMTAPTLAVERGQVRVRP